MKVGQFAVGAVATAIVLSASFDAQAQVEVRCPTGWTVAAPFAEGAPGQRPLVGCKKEPVQVGGLQLTQTVPTGSPAEPRVAIQLLMREGFPPPETMPTLRDETIGAVRARVYEVNAQGEGPGGTATRITGVVALIPVPNGGTLIVRAISTAARGNAMASLRTYVEAMVGLDGSAPAWRVSVASCPAPLSRAQTENGPPGGQRRAGLCASEAERRQVEVLESRIPVRNVAEARSSAEFFQVTMARTLSRVGGTATVGTPEPFAANGANGWVIPIHASAQAPSGETVRLEQMLVVLPTESGHLEVIATAADSADVAALRTLATTIATTHIRTDGSGVTVAAAGADGGAAAATPGERPSQEPAFDPNAPLWQPPAEDRPRATAPAAPKKGLCGCSTPGSNSARGDWFVALSAAAAMVASRRVWRNRRRS